MFGWLKRRQATVQPEAAWTVVIDEEGIRVTDHAGAAKSVLKSDLSGIIIETNDTGPWGADVWWLLFGADDRVACFFPQGATGENAVIEYFSAFAAFDHGEMTNAMRSTANASFPVWRRPISVAKAVGQ